MKLAASLLICESVLLKGKENRLYHGYSSIILILIQVLFLFLFKYYSTWIFKYYQVFMDNQVLLFIQNISPILIV